MPITIGSNIFAQRAQRQLASLSAAIGTSFERLSSGQRINRASDDAAGLAISDSLRADARTYSVAARNINDGASLLNVVQSVLQTQKFILGRLSEIAEQSANGVYSAEQRAALQEEYTSLLAEYGRTADAASFNGLSVAKGSRGGVSSLSIQAGIDGSVNSLLQVFAEDLGLFSGTLVVTGDLTTDGQNSGVPDGNSNIDDFNYLLGLFGPSFTLEELSDALEGSAFASLSLVDSAGNEREGLIAITQVLGQVQISIFAKDSGTGEFAGVGASFNVNFSNPLSIGLNGSGFSGQTLELDLRGLQLVSGLPSTDPRTSAVAFTGVESADRALAALEVIAARRNELSAVEGRIGAVQSRLESALAVVFSARENSLAAESRIRDIDVASESAENARLTILQQAAASVLGQANQQPALALALMS